MRSSLKRERINYEQCCDYLVNKPNVSSRNISTSLSTLGGAVSFISTSDAEVSVVGQVLDDSWVGVASDVSESDLKGNFRENDFFSMMHLKQQRRDATEEEK
jgi:hypothetical protein